MTQCYVQTTENLLMASDTMPLCSASDLFAY